MSSIPCPRNEKEFKEFLEELELINQLSTLHTSTINKTKKGLEQRD